VAGASLRDRMVDGTARVLLAEALIVPTGILTVAYLTRRLGPAEYGRYALAVALIAWLEWGVSAPFARAAVRVVGAATDWRPVATLVLRTQFLCGTAMAILLFVTAPLIAAALGEPRLASLLRLFSLDLPLFGLAQAHQQILVALGRFRTRALLPVLRWTTRLTLIVVGVETGLSTHGVVLAIVGTSFAEVLVARCFVRPPIFRRSGVPLKLLFDYAVPLILAAWCLRLFDRVDIVLLKLLGGSAADVGMYGAAQNLTVATGLVAVAFSPILLSTLTRAVHAGDVAHARQIARDSIRCVWLLLPFAALLAASAGDVIVLLFGEQYTTGTQVFQCLIFAGLAQVGVSIGGTILTGAGKPFWTLGVAAPLPAMAIVAHAWAIPRYGSTGAALVTATCATVGASMSFAAVRQLWQVAPPASSILRSVFLAAAGAVMAGAWSTPGVLVIAKLVALGSVVLVLLQMLGEFDDVAILKDLLP
jgi:O-antigen/teichoic acid export membrane protein